MKRLMKGIDLEKWMSKLKRIEDRVERLALLSQLGQILNSYPGAARGSEKGHRGSHPTHEGRDGIPSPYR